MSHVATPARSARAPRNTSKAAATIAAALVNATPAPVNTPAPVVVTTLANANGQAQADAIAQALKAAQSRAVVGALLDKAGNIAAAQALLAPSLSADVATIGRIIPILRSPAPAACYSDGASRSARVGELFATRLGLSALYRDASKADLKAAREALKADFTNAK